MADRPTPLDSYERAILTALQENGRYTVQELAARIGLSTSPTWRRLKALEQRGVIRDYVARIDAAALGYPNTVFVHVTLRRHSREEIDAFEHAVQARPEVLDFFAMTGDADYLMRVVIRNTRDYEHFLNDALFASGVVQQVRSHFALRQIKNSVALPVPEE